MQIAPAQFNASVGDIQGNTEKTKKLGAKGTMCGEVVFNTAITSHQEILTDPSYYEQIVTMTYPLIGNCGNNKA